MPVIAIDALRQLQRRASERALKPAPERLRREALALVEAESLAQAQASYRLVPLEHIGAQGLLCIEGHTLPAPWLLPERGQLTAVACAVCTLGPDLPARVQSLFDERRAALAVGLDALGNELLFAASRVLQDRMLADARRQGLSMAGELRAGDPGLAIETQGTVLQLAQAERVGVRLSAGGMMHPVKTTSMVLGVGLALPPAPWSRCDHCPTRDRCKLVQSEATA